MAKKSGVKVSSKTRAGKLATNKNGVKVKTKVRGGRIATNKNARRA